MCRKVILYIADSLQLYSVQYLDSVYTFYSVQGSLCTVQQELQGLELELDSLSMERAVELLEGLSSLNTSRREEGRQEVREAWGRARPVAREASREDWSGLEEVQDLARAAACLARTGGLPPGTQLERLWDLARAGDSTLATDKVNRARRFLHSSASSGSSQARTGCC